MVDEFEIEIIDLDAELGIASTPADRAWRRQRNARPPLTRERLVRTGLGATVSFITLFVLAASIALLWPAPPATASTAIHLGPRSGLLHRLAAKNGPILIESAGRPAFFIARFPPDDALASAYPFDVQPGLRAGLIALSVKDPHLNERIAFCASSGWFEEPLHGSKWDAIGEKTSGPTPRGMSIYRIVVDQNDFVTVDLAPPLPGLPIGLHFIHGPAQGPHCVA
jgi:hypothetical protein